MNDIYLHYCSLYVMFMWFYYLNWIGSNGCYCVALGHVCQCCVYLLLQFLTKLNMIKQLQNNTSRHRNECFWPLKESLRSSYAHFRNPQRYTRLSVFILNPKTQSEVHLKCVFRQIQWWEILQRRIDSWWISVIFDDFYSILRLKMYCALLWRVDYCNHYRLWEKLHYGSFVQTV